MKGRKRTGEKLGSAYFSSVFFLNGVYFCSKARLGSTSGGGRFWADTDPAGGTGFPCGSGVGVPLPMTGVPPPFTPEAGKDEPAGINAGGGPSGGRDMPGWKGGVP